MKKSQICYKRISMAVTALVLSCTAMTISSCTDDDSSESATVNNPIGFKIDLSQQWIGTNNAKKSNAPKILPRNIQMKTSDGSTAFLQETAISAINDFQSGFPTKKLPVRPASSQSYDAATRGTLITDVASMSSDGFSSWCYYDNGQLYFDNIKSDKEGNLTVAKSWEKGKSLRFYAIHPFDASNFGGDANGLTYNFTVNPDVEKQEDLMYASTGVLPYNDEGLAPLHFQHALTAVSFAFGSNPDFNKTISSIAIKGVHTKGTYILPVNATENDEYSLIQGTWTNLNTTADFTLSNLNVPATLEHANQVITGPTQTFLLLPEESLEGVSFEIKFTDNTSLTYNFSASDKWFAGHTYTYRLSKKAEDLTYQLRVVGDCDFGGNAIATGSSLSHFMNGWASVYNMPYDETDLDWSGYGCLIQSIKYNTNSEISAVPWEIVEYEYSEDGGTTWISTGKRYPAWVDRFVPEEGAGVTSGSSWDQVFPYFHPSTFMETETPEAAARTARILANSTRGTSSSRFDLSTHDIKGASTPRNTANSYVISAPGYYKLPLVYGNAITNGVTNSQAYVQTKPTEAEVRAAHNYSGYEYTEDLPFLTHFINYKGNAITDPWIETDGTPTTAELVWADRMSLQTLVNSNLQVVQESGHYYLYFDAADKEQLVQGNAVVAVKDASGVVMWSWHLWFAPDDVLETVTVKSPKNNSDTEFNTNNVAKETLGYTLGYSYTTSYTQDRLIRAKVQQKEGDGNGPLSAYIRIRQIPLLDVLPIHSTLYQFGRKDALSGINYFYPGHSPSNDNFPTMSTVTNYADAIKNPGIIINGSSGGWMQTLHSNVWSARYVHISSTFSDNYDGGVIKTVYDPCPPGYRMGTPRTYVGFGTINTHSGQVYEVSTDPTNVSGSWNNGWNFYTDNTNTNTVYFPATGYREGNSLKTGIGLYHPALPEVSSQSLNFAHVLYFTYDKVQAYNCGYNLAIAGAVRPVKE